YAFGQGGTATMVSRNHRSAKPSTNGKAEPGARHGLQLLVLGPTLDGGSSFTSLAQLQEGGGHAAVEAAHPEGGGSTALRRGRRQKPRREALRPRRPGLGHPADADRRRPPGPPRNSHRKDARRGPRPPSRGPRPGPRRPPLPDLPA